MKIPYTMTKDYTRKEFLKTLTPGNYSTGDGGPEYKVTLESGPTPEESGIRIEMFIPHDEIKATAVFLNKGTLISKRISFEGVPIFLEEPLYKDLYIEQTIDVLKSHISHQRSKRKEKAEAAERKIIERMKKYGA